MTLPFVAAMRFYLLHLLFCLDALRDHSFVEAGAETGDRADDRLRVALFPKPANKRLIDLDLLEREFAQVVERRIAGAEVVERNTDAEILELLHCRQRFIVVFEQ